MILALQVLIPWSSRPSQEVTVRNILKPRQLVLSKFWRLVKMMMQVDMVLFIAIGFLPG